MSCVKVYAGLTLTEDEVHRHCPGAIFAPPIARRDLPADLSAGVRVVVIIDGRFHQVAAVSCSEIVDALRSGLIVYGASSMGALRACELSAYGMRGVGRIFAYLQRNPYFRDDFLGQTFSLGTGQVQSRAFIDLLFNIEDLAAANEIDAGQRQALLNLCRDLHYAERHLGHVLERVEADYGADARLHEAARRVFLEMGSQKKRDAIEALAQCRRDLGAVAEINRRLNVVSRDEALEKNTPHYGIA